MKFNTHSDIASCTDPIFIIGTPRSGTTLLAKTLNQHSKIFMPGETHFIDDIYLQRNKLGDPSDETSRNIIIRRLSDLYERYNEPKDQLRINKLIEQGIFKQTLFEHGVSFQKLFSMFMQIQMQIEKKQRWGNNAPRDIFNIIEIIQFYPNAKILVCVRDVRAFLLSYKGKWRITRESNEARLRKLYHPVITSILWKTSMRNLCRIEKIVPSENLAIIRYEDLVTNPENIITKVCNIIGEDFEYNMLNIDTNNSSLSGEEKGIFTTSLTTWHTELSAEEIIISQILNSTEMRRHGYNSYNIKANWFKVLIFTISAPWALLQGLRANKNMYGNIFTYLFRRIVALFRK